MMRKNKEEKQKIVAGKTIVGKRENKEEKSLDTERERLRKKSKRRTILSVFGISLVVIILGILGTITVKNLMEMTEEVGVVVVPEEKFEPTVEIYDENGTNMVSEKMKELVGQLESDLKDLGVKMTRVVLPAGKLREIDVNIEGMSPYFKVNTERGTGVSAEDIAKMAKYVTANDLAGKISYVDVRVEGKAFYK